jgi:predicted metal-dependent hydrolase
MRKSITIGHEKIELLIERSSRVKRLKLAICPGGTLRATIPTLWDLNLLKDFIGKNKFWILEKLAGARKRNVSFLQKGGRREYLANREHARRLIRVKIEEWNSNGRFLVNRIFIRNQKTRWGSCSSNGNLNFNWRVVYLEEPLVDYLVVHELCHLEEMNHSPDFWQLVAELFPNYKKTRRELRRL